MAKQNETEGVALPAFWEIDILTGAKKLVAKGSAVCDNIWSTCYGTKAED